jgi:hypothetical protein
MLIGVLCERGNNFRTLAIRKRLWDALQKAQRKHTKVCKKFDTCAAEVGTGISAPDGAFRIEEAGRERQLSFEAYRQALAEFSDFIAESYPYRGARYEKPPCIADGGI